MGGLRFHRATCAAASVPCCSRSQRCTFVRGRYRSPVPVGLYFRPKSITYGHSISRCALLNAPAGSFSRDIVKIERDRVIVTRVCACALWRSEMPTGTVKWFNGQKGFGFIQPSDGGNDVFVHISAVERAGLSGLAEGQKVAFEIKADKMRGKTSAENSCLACAQNAMPAPFHGCTAMALRPARSLGLSGLSSCHACRRIERSCRQSALRSRRMVNSMSPPGSSRQCSTPLI